MYRRDFIKCGVAAVAACAGASALSGCGSTDKRVAEYGERTVRVATAGSGEPYSLIDSSGKWTGICADMWEEVGKVTGWKIEAVNSIDDAGALGNLMAEKADVAASGFRITKKRLELYLACDPLFADAQVMAVGSDSKAQTLDDLQGKTIGVAKNGAAKASVDALASSYKWDVKELTNAMEGVREVASGDIDGFADSVIEVRGAERGQGNAKLKILTEVFDGDNVSWFTLPSNKELRDQLNKAIKAMHEDGTLSKLCEKWFREDLTGYVTDKWLTANR